MSLAVLTAPCGIPVAPLLSLKLCANIFSPYLSAKIAISRELNAWKFQFLS